MKTHYATTALALATALIAGSGFAAEGGALSREQVRAEFLQARADGTLVPVNEQGMLPAMAIPSSVTRAAVMADTLAASKSAKPYFANRSAEFLPAARNDLATRRSRPEVRLEAIASVKHHTQDFGG